MDKMVKTKSTKEIYKTKSFLKTDGKPQTNDKQMN